jgi:hypothetical protein
MRKKQNLSKNKKQFFYLLTFLFIILFSVLQSSLIKSLSSTSDTCNIDVSLVNQDPYPATPDSYLNILLQVTGVGTTNCGGAKISLSLDYPFSMDSNNNLRILQANTYNKDGFKDVWNVPYTLRVDKNALEGDSQLTVKYSPGNWDSDSYLTKKFNISIKNYQTNFDAVIQDFSSNQVSIALANTGKYTANAVVVRVPQQENYAVSSSDGQMVGNLDSGDYTLVSFSLIQKSTQIQNKNQTLQNQDRIYSKNLTNPNQQIGGKDLLIQVYYTDNLGERRVVNMSLPLNMQSFGSSNLTSSNFTKYNVQKKSSFPWFWVALIFVLLVIILYKKFPKQFKDFLKKLKGKSKEKENQKSQIPDWIKNSKEKK